jgi:hypothetical protein
MNTYSFKKVDPGQCTTPSVSEQWAWQDLVPGISSIEDAVAKLGSISSSTKYVNATCHSFCNGAVEIITLDGESIIANLRILAGFAGKDGFPSSLDDTEALFGPLRRTGMDEFGTVFYEKPGMRIACEFLTSPQKIKSVELYPLAMSKC